MLGLNGCDGSAPVGNFCGTGMHGGRIFLRCEALPCDLPAQVHAEKAGEDDLASIMPYLAGYQTYFGDENGFDAAKLDCGDFYVLTPDSKNPYRQLYIGN